MCGKECREWNWQSQHCYYPQPYRGNTELAPEESAVWLGSDAGAATELLHCIASLILVAYLAPTTIGDSFSNKPHKSVHIYGWLNRRYAWEGGNWKKLQQKCSLEHPCTGENTIKSPLLWQPMECPLGWSLSGGNGMWGRLWAALHSGIFDGICALRRSLDVSSPLQFL